MAASASPVIDCQVHCYERNRPERPWAGTLHGPDEVTGDHAVAVMDRLGIDGALLVSPWAMYRYDASYAQEVHARHPGRFGLVKPFDPADPGVVEAMAEWGRTARRGGRPPHAGRAGAAAGGSARRGSHPGRPAPRHGLPVNVLCWGNLAAFAELADRHPNTQLVVDHLGLRQPFEPQRPFAELDDVLALARFDNVAIKISGACTLSREPFPYADIWAPLARLFEQFGIDRCLWGTDWTRAVALLTPDQAVAAFRVADRLSDRERAALMGGSLVRIYGWAPADRGA